MTDRLEVYQDKNGTWWIWDTYLCANIAIRQPSESAARADALDSLLFYTQMFKESRDELREKYARVEALFEELFGESENSG